MSTKKMSIFMAVLSAVMLVGGAAFAAHTGGQVVLMDAAGNFISGGTTSAYSPKTTCGTTGCHAQYILNRGLSGLSNIYEGSPAVATKTQSGASYDVSYPQHGVTAGYHFQQGRNVPWGSTQKSYYGLPAFTSSPGMYGKY